ncbi:MAG: hypothetical protein JXQ73_00850 [Phycisphaerae bacterium]|nr:hypothetical protein [Phycisphaerae bacterium]
MACMALWASGDTPDRWQQGLAWLAGVAAKDGSVPITSAVPSAAWPTAIAALAWLRAGRQLGHTYNAHVERALAWLLALKGLIIQPDPTVYGHDTTLQGWPWIAETHSWVEPTAYAILALRAAGKADHPRVREGVKLLLDRALPGGGWNYGNKRILANELRPFPATTGIALAALAPEPVGEQLKPSIDYATRELGRIRAPFTMAWGLIGLTAWDARPPAAQEWLQACAARSMKGQPNILQDALLLLAGMEKDRNPLVSAVGEQTHA